MKLTKILWPIWALGHWGDTGCWCWPPPSPREAVEGERAVGE